ncbi:MAG: yhbY [Clostridiales bacterium]|nr:yhbY [Clostridiales bacterium]
MLSSKQRSFLRALGNNIDPIILIGKEGISEGIIKQADEALEAREIVKASVLKNSLIDARSACEEICEATSADPVQVIGNKFVIYRKSKEKPSIQLP